MKSRGRNSSIAGDRWSKHAHSTSAPLGDVQTSSSHDSMIDFSA